MNFDFDQFAKFLNVSNKKHFFRCKLDFPMETVSPCAGVNQ